MVCFVINKFDLVLVLFHLQFSCLQTFLFFANGISVLYLATTCGRLCDDQRLMFMILARLAFSYYFCICR